MIPIQINWTYGVISLDSSDIQKLFRHVWYLNIDMQQDLFKMAHIKLEVPYQLNQKNRKQLSWAYNRSRKHIKRFLNLTSSWLVWHTGCLPVQPLKSSLVMLQYLSFYNHRQNLYYQICFILIQPTGYTITKGISNIWFSHYNHFFSVGKMRGKSENKKSPNLP